MENLGTVYEPPALAEVGDFSKVTLGELNWGFDAVWWCAFLGCWSEE